MSVVCVREREREREVCVHACVCACERCFWYGDMSWFVVILDLIFACVFPLIAGVVCIALATRSVELI